MWGDRGGDGLLTWTAVGQRSRGTLSLADVVLVVAAGESALPPPPAPDSAAATAADAGVGGDRKNGGVPLIPVPCGALGDAHTVSPAPSAPRVTLGDRYASRAEMTGATTGGGGAPDGDAVALNPPNAPPQLTLPRTTLSLPPFALPSTVAAVEILGWTMGWLMSGLRGGSASSGLSTTSSAVCVCLCVFACVCVCMCVVIY
jgi:hypothetical protein